MPRKTTIGFAGGLLCVLSLVTIFCVYSVNLRFNHALIIPIKVGWAKCYFHDYIKPPGVLPYTSHIDMCPTLRVWFLRHFSLITGIDWNQVWGMYKRIYLSFQFQMNKKERVICAFKMDFKKSFNLLLF